MPKIETFSLFASLTAVVALGGLAAAKITKQTNETARINAPIALPNNLKAADVLDASALVDAKSFPANNTAPYTIVEFADYQCPPCGRMHQALQEWLPLTKGQVRLAFRNLPLDMHPFARSSAVAAEAAREQGKFWQMHDLLYSNQNNLGDEYVKRYAVQVGVNMTRFDRAKNSFAKRRVEDDLAAVKKLGIHSTPTLVLCEPDGSAKIVTLSYLQNRF